MTADIGQIASAHADSQAMHKCLSAFYEDLDSAIAARAPVCTNRGLCCNFESYGHDLFVTSVELAHFVAGHADAWKQPTAQRSCPYQIDGKCTARDHRPMGCRVFFCDESSRDWQNAEYEKRLAELKRIGDDLNIEYRYAEWLSALKSVSKDCIRQVSSPGQIKAPGEFIDPRSLPVIESE